MAKTDASLLVRIGANLDDLDKAIGQMGSRFDKVGANLRGIGTSLTKWVTAPMVAAGGLALKSSIDFESAFAGVRKTVDASEETFKQLEAGIRSMAREIPASAGAIAQVAEAAGQLGIETENILSFTRVMIDLGEATNLSADEAATALARLANITGMPQESFDRLGSSIVALGNSLATTEAEIVNMSLRLAGAGAQIGLTEAEILGFAAALSSVGIEAEAGGSAFSKVMIEMAQAARSGGEELDLFAQVAGVTAQQFREAFETDAAGAIQMFIEGLGRMSEEGGNTFGVLEELGFAEVRVRDALLRMSGASDVLVDSLRISNRAWEENTALTNEAAQRYATTESVLRILWNRLAEVARTVGDALRPAFMALLQTLEPVFQKVEQLAQSFADADPSIQRLVIGIGVLAGSIGPVVAGLGTLMGAASALKAGMTALGISMEAALIGSGVGAAVVGLGAAALVVYQNWDKVREFFDSRFPGAIDKAKGVFDTLIGIAKDVMGGVVDAVSGALDTIQSLIKSADGVIKGDWEQIFTGLLEITKQWTDHQTTLIENYFKGAKEQWTTYGKWMVEGLRGGFREGLNKWRQDLIKSVSDFFGGGFREGVNKARIGLLAAVKNVYGEAVGSAYTSLQDLNRIGDITGSTLEGLENRFKRVAGATSDVVNETDKLIASQDDLQASSEEIASAWDKYNEALRDAEIEHRVMRDDLAFLKSNISAAEGLMKSLIKLGVDPASEAFRQLEEDVRLAYAALLKMEAAAKAVNVAISSLPTQQQRENAKTETGYAPRLLTPEALADMERLKQELSYTTTLGDKVTNAIEGIITKLGSQGLGGAIARTFGLTGAWGLGINAGIEALKGMGFDVDEFIKKAKESFAQLAQAIGETFANIGKAVEGGLRGAGRWVAGWFPGYGGDGSNAPGDTPRGGIGRGTRPPTGDLPPRGAGPGFDYDNWVGPTLQSQIDAVFKEIEASFKEIEIEAQVMGEGFDKAGAEIRVMEQGLIDLLNAGVSPTNEQFIELSEKLEAARAEAAALARQMEIDSIFSGLAEDLASIEQRALVMGSGFDVAGAKVSALQSRMIELLQAGIEPTSEEFLALAGDLAVAREEAQAFADQMRVQDIWSGLGASLEDIRIKAQFAGDGFNRFSLEAQAIEQAMIELIKEGQQTTPQFNNLARSLEETREQAARLDAELAIKAFWDRLEKDMKRIEAQAYVLGDSFNAAAARVRVIEQAMIDFIANGGDPASEAFKRLEAMLQANKVAAKLVEDALKRTADAAREASEWVEDYNEAMQGGTEPEPEPETPAVPEPIHNTIQNITNVTNNFNTSRLESGMDRLVRAAEILTDVNARGFTTLGYIMKGGDVSFEAIKRLPDLLKAASFDVTKLNKVTIGEGVTQNIYVQLDGSEIARATFIGMPSVANVYGVS